MSFRIDVLDAGCGRGRALTAMAQRYPNSRFVGYDLCQEATSYAQLHAQQLNLKNITFTARDLSDFDDEEQFDLITSFDAVHDQRNALPHDPTNVWFVSAKVTAMENPI